MTSSKKSRERWRDRWLRGEFNKFDKEIEKKDKTLDEYENKN